MSASKVTCPNCQAEISIDDVLTHQIEADLKHQIEAKHRQELAAKTKEMEEAKKQIEESARKQAIDQVRQEYILKIENTKSQAETQEKQNKELRVQLRDLLSDMRAMKEKDEKRELEFQKKLLEEQDAIRRRAKEEAVSESQLSIAQKDKQLEDLRKQLVEAQRKAEQGSQQTQGEVQELVLQEILSNTFISDEIREVPKGIDGADVIQLVKNRSGICCGTIVWESKNTKLWSSGWIPKLKNDQRTLKAELAVIVSKALPEDIKGFGLIDGIWISDLATVIGLATSLRQQLIEIKSAKSMAMNMSSKAEVVYDYLSSNSFKQRIEVWVEYFLKRREEIDKERAYFTKKWEKETKSIELVFNNTAGIYGDLQGLMGNALPKVNYLELPDELDSNL